MLLLNGFDCNRNFEFQTMISVMKWAQILNAAFATKKHHMHMFCWAPMLNKTCPMFSKKMPNHVCLVFWNIILLCYQLCYEFLNCLVTNFIHTTLDTLCTIHTAVLFLTSFIVPCFLTCGTVLNLNSGKFATYFNQIVQYFTNTVCNIY